LASLDLYRALKSFPKDSYLELRQPPEDNDKPGTRRQLARMKKKAAVQDRRNMLSTSSGSIPDSAVADLEHEERAKRSKVDEEMDEDGT
jgi:hypothetical protein